MFKLILFDIKKDVFNALYNAFRDIEEVQVLHTPFESLKNIDCIVSPANSFGIMDGGFDLILTQYFGTQLMERVQEYIVSEFAGEQPIGTSFVIKTGDNKHPYLAHTPTMRIPMDINNTDNVYRAMKAMLVEVNKFNRLHNDTIKTVGCTGLGTWAGKMPVNIASMQMRMAYDHVKNPPEKITVPFAIQRHFLIDTMTKI